MNIEIFTAGLLGDLKTNVNKFCDDPSNEILKICDIQMKYNRHHVIDSYLCQVNYRKKDKNSDKIK